MFTVPVEEGSSRNISVDGTTHEYTAIWSPGGDQLASITESEGGQSLVLKDQSGMSEARVYELGPYFYRLLAWGADDDPRIVFQDNHLSLYAIRLPGGSISKIATGARCENIEVSISGDGNWSVENEGVAPDIEVALDPIASNQGQDTQLERAISQVLSQLEGFESKIPTEAPALPTELGR